MGLQSTKVCVFVLSLWARVVITENANFSWLWILHSNSHTTFQPEDIFMPTRTQNLLNNVFDNDRKKRHSAVEKSTITPELGNLERYIVSNKLANFNKKCQQHEQCGWMENEGSSLRCLAGVCSCPRGYVFVKWPYEKAGCYVKAVLFGNCEVTEQCKTPHTSCSTSGKCLCNFGYTFLYGEGCVQNPNKSTKEKNVYMAVLVVMTIIMFIVVGIIIIFLARRVICYGGGGQNNERPNDTLTINNQPGSVLSVDKPPTYEEVMDREEEMFRIPPPKYNEIETVHPFFNPVRLYNSLDNLRSPSDVPQIDDTGISITRTEIDDSIATTTIQDITLDISNHEEYLATSRVSTESSPSALSQESEAGYQIYSNPAPTIVSDTSYTIAKSELDAMLLPSTSGKGYYDNPTFHRE